MECTSRIVRGIVLAHLLLVVGCSGSSEHLVIDLTDEDLRGEPDSRTRIELLEGGLMVDYYLEVADRITVDFFFNRDLTTDLVVRPDGRITLPGIGEVMAVGRTPREISDEIEERYSDILLQPAVTVILKDTAEPAVYVIGMVKHAGPITYSRNITAVSAIAAAGPYDIVFVPKRFVSHLKDFSLDVVRTVVPATNLYLRGWE